MPAANLNLGIEKGAAWQPPTFTLYQGGSLVNLTGYTATLEILTSQNGGTPLATLTSGSGLTLGGALGTIVATLSAAATAALNTAALSQVPVTIQYGTDSSGNPFYFTGLPAAFVLSIASGGVVTYVAKGVMAISNFAQV